MENQLARPAEELIEGDSRFQFEYRSVRNVGVCGSDRSTKFGSIRTNNDGANEHFHINLQALYKTERSEDLGTAADKIFKDHKIPSRTYTRDLQNVSIECSFIPCRFMISPSKSSRLALNIVDTEKCGKVEAVGKASVCNSAHSISQAILGRCLEKDFRSIRCETSVTTSLKVAVREIVTSCLTSTVTEYCAIERNLICLVLRRAYPSCKS